MTIPPCSSLLSDRNSDSSGPISSGARAKAVFFLFVVFEGSDLLVTRADSANRSLGHTVQWGPWTLLRLIGSKHKLAELETPPLGNFRNSLNPQVNLK
jgi:hypothetical protein